MGKQFDQISDRHRAFIERQPMFFVATAARDGHVNVSPKGLDSFRVLGPRRVVWLNPRAAATGFQPLVGSMAAALPYCDAFLPADRLSALPEVFEAIAGR